MNSLCGIGLTSVLFGLACVSGSAGQGRASDPASTDVAEHEPVRDLRGFRIDERRELEAVASRTLTWLTGSSEQNDYISVGRLAHYFGFIKFRVSSGNSVARSGVAQETFSQLDLSQRDRLLELVEEQREPFARAVAARIEVNRALDRLRSGEGVEREDFLELGERYGQAEAELGRVLAVGLGEVATLLDDEQRERLGLMRGCHVSGRAEKFVMPREVKAEVRHLDRRDTQELWNVVSRLFTWVTGTPEDNDFETVGKPSQHFGFVSLRVESGHAVKRGAIAKEVLSKLNGPQRQELERVVHEEASRFDAFLSVRSSLCRELERALTGERIRKNRVAFLGGEMGRAEAAMTWAQASGILSVRDLLSPTQAEGLLAMRRRYVPDEDGRAGNELDDLEPKSLLAAQISRGRQVFARCSLCHASRPGARASAPSLQGVVGREIARERSFDSYSIAMERYAARHRTWTEELLDVYLRSPRTAVPGTIMGFDGIADDTDREAVIQYLKAISG